MKPILALIFCLTLNVASVPAQNSGATAGARTDSVPPMPFPARGGDVDWGLALSGGGLRSAAFSIGAMKALYDIGVMDDIDVISSVSGGGYASYWLYSRYSGAREQFGDGAFHPDNFPANICKLSSKSEFFPIGRMVAAAFSPRSQAFTKYRDSIEHSFGRVDIRACEDREDCYPRMRRLGDLLPEINAGHIPYFIINTTIESRKTRTRKLGKVEKTFELAPTYRGSEALGYAGWTRPDPNITTWCDAVAISGAGIRFKLSRTIANHSEQLEDDEIDLADGGLSENLAALPLIRRGIKNVIIIDAENDPSYKFESYTLLKKHLATKKIDLVVDKIDTFLSDRKKRGKTFTEAAVAIGRAGSMPGYSGPTIGTTIYYIKMSRPATIFPPELRGKKLPEAAKQKPTSRPASCDADQITPITGATLRNDTLEYARFLNKDWPWGKFFAFLPYINYNFPQITTIDQTFYSDQLKAFIGLGYLETCEMKETAGIGNSCSMGTLAVLADLESSR